MAVTFPKQRLYHCMNQKATKTPHCPKRAVQLLKMAFRVLPALPLNCSSSCPHQSFSYFPHSPARHVLSSLTLLLIFNHSQVYFVSFSIVLLKSLSDTPVQNLKCLGLFSLRFTFFSSPPHMLLIQHLNIPFDLLLFP